MYSGGIVTISKSASELILTMFGAALQSSVIHNDFTRDAFSQFEWPFDELEKAYSSNKLLVLDTSVDFGGGVSIGINVPVSCSKMPGYGVTITFSAHNFLFEPVVCTMVIGTNSAGVVVKSV